MRIGSGYDIHRLANGRKLMLGGIEIPSTKGEEAHSDGDVLLHALIDALLGSEANGDIGSHFPPCDPEWKDADSRKLLETVLKEYKHRLINIDCTILLERPKLRPHIDAIRASLADLLAMDPADISVKAKTAEGCLAEFGTGDAVAASVTLLAE